MENESEPDEAFRDIDWDNSDLDFSDDDDLIDPNFELSKMFKELQCEPDSESDVESETADSAISIGKKAAKRRRAHTIDKRPKKKKRLMPTTYTEVDVVVMPTIESNPESEVTLNQTLKDQAEKYSRMFEGREIDVADDIVKNLTWEDKFHVADADDLAFIGSEELPDEIANLQTPYQFWSYLVSDEIIAHLVEQTNLYALQQNRELDVTLAEMKRFIGINHFMTVYKHPSSRSYWSKYGFSPINTSMPVTRYENIRSYLHVNDNSQMLDKSDPNHDKLFKIRPLISMFNQQFSKVPFRHHLDIDEQICKSKASNFLRQYLPNKPHPWGTKLFLLCDDLGYCYQFEVYCGGENHTLQPGEVDLKATGNTVVRLMRLVPTFVNHKLYIDNYYTSIALMVYLRAHGILTCGTMRRNRIPNCELPTDLKKRGEMVEHVTNCRGIDITTVAWKDTKMVTMASTFVGSKPSKKPNSDEIADPQLIDRWNKKKKCVETIPCPQAVVEYNRYMGGVDLMDSSLGRYHISVKTRKWPTRLAYHLLDMAMVNAWTLYKRATKKNVKLCVFISDVAEVLCRAGNIEHRRGRPPKNDPLPPPNVQSKKRNVIKTPTDIRFDGIDHLPMAETDTQVRCRCQNEDCKSRSQIYCIKCRVHLCCNSNRNCYTEYHTQQ